MLYAGCCIQAPLSAGALVLPCTRSWPARCSLQVECGQIRLAAQLRMRGQLYVLPLGFECSVTAMARPGPSQRLKLLQFALSALRLVVRARGEGPGQLADAGAVSAGVTDSCTLTTTPQGPICRAEPCPGALADWAKCEEASFDAPNCPAGAVQYSPCSKAVCCHAQVHTARSELPRICNAGPYGSSHRLHTFPGATVLMVTQAAMRSSSQQAPSSPSPATVASPRP
jgi:hypothetical protein